MSDLGTTDPEEGTDRNGTEPEPEPEAEAGGERPDGPRGGTSGESAGDESDEPPEGQTINFVLNAFHELTADGATFGVAGHGAAGQAPETGRIDSARVSTTVERYVEPAPYSDARRALAENRVIVLAGTRGCGKRTGAIALLRDVLPVDAPIVSLSPTATLEELAKRLTRRHNGGTGAGYVVFDRVITQRDREADHQWEVLCGKARESGRHLVITTGEQDRRPHESVRRIGWERPGTAEALRAHMGDAGTDEAISGMLAALPSEHTMADLIAAAERVAAGASPDEAVTTVFDRSERQEVEDWFAHDPAVPQVLDVTTLAFAPGIGVRDFESLRARLGDLLAERRPEPRPDDGTDAPAALPRRSERLFKDGLIRLDRAVVDGVPRKTLVFQERGHRRHVLEKLHDEYGIDFWDAVRGWLHEVVRVDAWRLRIASGVALVAHASFDEVEASYLAVWSSGAAGWKGRYTAAATLWFMCLDEELRPLALRTAVRWASYGSVQNRLTAIVTFAGELGARYPTEASRRLWQLARQPGELSPVAADAFGDLFAGLGAREQDARQTVQHLGKQVGGPRPAGTNGVRLHRTSLCAALAVVRARNPVTGRPAIIEYICADPAEIPAVARMWAALLRHRPTRHGALTALHSGLHEMGKLTPSASDHARLLGDALGEALPDHENEALARDFIRRTRRRKNSDHSAELARILIRTLERAHRARKV